MSSKTEICNLALSHLGVGKEIAILESERSQEASACRRFYDTALDATLRDYPWAFATKIVALGLIEEDPNDEWLYSYRYPTDCVFIKRILSGIKNDTRQTRINYRILSDSAGRIIYTDQENAEAEYSYRVTDTSLYPSDFIMALSYRLAHYIAPRVTAGDPYKLKREVMELYLLEIGRAKSNNNNEEQDAEDPESEFIRVRE